MESQSRLPLKEISSGVKDNFPATQTQRPLGVSKSKHMINKPLPKSTNTSSIPQPPSSRRQTSVRARSNTTSNEPVNKRLTAAPKRSFVQKPRQGTKTVSRTGTEASRRDTLQFNRTNASRGHARGLTATRTEAVPAADKMVFTQFTSILERVDQSVQSLKESKDSVGEGANERLLETISQLESVRPEYERKLEELMEEKMECKSQLLLAQTQIKDMQSELDVERKQVKTLEDEIQKLRVEVENVASTRSVSDDASEKVEKLQKKLEDLQSAFDLLHKKKIEVEDEAKKRQTTLESDLDSTTTKLKDAMRRVELAEEEQSTLEGALRRAKRENDELESERLQTEESLKKRIKSLQSQVEDLEANRDKLERQNATSEAQRKEERDSFESYKEELKPQLHELEKQRDSLRKANANLEADLSARTDELSNFKESVSLQERKISSINSEKMALELKLDALHNDLTNSRGERQKLIAANEETKKQVGELERQAREDAAERRRLHNTIQELKGNIRVFCRIRPPLGTEIQSSKDEMFRYTEKGQGVVAKSPANDPSRTNQSYPFKFDRVFDPTSSQDTVFEEISQLVQSAIDGYRVCIFAYGQTGSGKTYTMLGERNGGDSNLGMVPRSIQQVFETARSMKKDGWTFDLKASFLEIYNESIRDLLVDNSPGASGKAKEHRVVYSQDKKSSSVSNLTVEAVKDEAHIQKLIAQSMKNRATAATQSNERSSRSHSVFRLYVQGKNSGTREYREGLLNLIDLAGSERLEKSKAEGERLRETKHINKSLSALGDVISALSQKAAHIPYRNSKLTHLLQDSLGGDSKALMFVNLSHAPDSFNESLCSLRFAAKVNNCHVGTAQRSAKIDL